MTTHRTARLHIVLALLLSCSAVTAWAQRGDEHRRGEGFRNNHGDEQRRGEGFKANPGMRSGVTGRVEAPGRGFQPGFQLDPRFGHNRYYPPRGHIVEALPRGIYSVPHREGNFFYHSGIWYRPSGPRYIVAVPPPGLVVPVLPSFYTTIWFGAVPYYYAGGVYYLYRPEDRSYVVAEPPPESQVSVTTSRADDLYIYPKKNQSEAQQATDRYECHKWAFGQTGFDPTQPGGNVPDAQMGTKRAEYQRAMTACLEGRGYSVK